MLKKQIKGAVFLFIFAVATAFGFNYFSPFGIAFLGQWQKSEGVVNAVSKTTAIDSGIEINNPEAVKQIIEKKQRIVIDVRPYDFFELGHLPGALSFPLNEFDAVIAKLLKITNQQSPILVYCSGFECTDSHSFAANLKQLKFEDVKVYSGGFTQWQEMGYEIEKNEK